MLYIATLAFDSPDVFKLRDRHAFCSKFNSISKIYAASSSIVCFLQLVAKDVIEILSTKMPKRERK
jgi:hypothetical protein